jgi:hypothetical protein
MEYAVYPPPPQDPSPTFFIAEIHLPGITKLFQILKVKHQWLGIRNLIQLKKLKKKLLFRKLALIFVTLLQSKIL